MGLVWLNNLNYIYSQRISDLNEEREIWLARYNRIRVRYYRRFPLERYYRYVEAETISDSNRAMGRDSSAVSGKDSTDR